MLLLYGNGNCSAHASAESLRLRLRCRQFIRRRFEAAGSICKPVAQEAALSHSTVPNESRGVSFAATAAAAAAAAATPFQPEATRPMVGQRPALVQVVASCNLAQLAPIWTADANAMIERL